VAVVAVTAAALAAAACWYCGYIGGQRVGSMMAAGMAGASVVTAVLPPHAAMVAMKTLALTVMAGAHTTINNQP
jgi:hypothetical protein